MTKVLLLKNTPDDGPDKYADAIRARGYASICVPVLETGLVNLEDLEIIVKQANAKDGYAGVIITSARACEAWRTVVERLHFTLGDQLPQQTDMSWSMVPFYVVGEATATALRNINQAFPNSPFVPMDIRGAAETGTSERLAHFIIDDLGNINGNRTLFYLTGDKNRDTLPKILQRGGFELSSLQVYETHGSSAFPYDLKEAIDANPSDIPWWIVFFAPSTAEFVTPFLQERFHLNSPENPGESQKTKKLRTFVAAIGPTTAKFVVDTLQLNVDVTSPQPDPESLTRAIEDFNARQPGAALKGFPIEI